MGCRLDAGAGRLLRTLDMRLLSLAMACLACIGVTGCSSLGSSSRSASTVESTPELVARGEYLARHVTMCVDCHSPRVRDRYGMPPTKGFEFAGGDCWGAELGVPGKACMPNITPDHEHGVGQWTDGEIMRAIREGISRDGRTLFPMMPYPAYHALADEDLHAIVAYLRTTKPVAQKAPPSEFPPAVREAISVFPKPVAGPVTAPARSNSVEYGGYLTRIAGCSDCHTQRGPAGPNMELAFAGGMEFNLSGVLHVRSANLTPDPETGMGAMTREQFISRFKAFADAEAVTASPIAPARQTIMPWVLYGGMTEEDLGAIYDFLRTVKPIKNKVELFPLAATAQPSAGSK
jgi:mono/diheme cytochrome c family protein